MKQGVFLEKHLARRSSFSRIGIFLPLPYFSRDVRGAASPAAFHGGKVTSLPSHSKVTGCSVTSATLEGGAGSAAAHAACCSDEVASSL